MATSGTTVAELTRDTIISAALRKLGVIGEGVTANATQLSDGASALNTLVASFQTLGMPLWKRTEYDITMVAGQRDYTLGVGQTLNTAFPLKISEATLVVTGSSAQIDVEIKSNYDFNRLPSDTSGRVVSIKYQPYVNYGVVSVWPLPDSTVQTLTITYQKPFDMYTAAGETPDFPQEWQNALIYGLTLLLSDEYGIPIPDKQWFEKQAEKHLNTALSFGTEESSLMFQPNMRG